MYQEGRTGLHFRAPHFEMAGWILSTRGVEKLLDSNLIQSFKAFDPNPYLVASQLRPQARYW
jgi:hypothetical protein